MSYRFVRCPHCKMPHDAEARVCPTTQKQLGPTVPRKPLPPPISSAKAPRPPASSHSAFDVFGPPPSSARSDAADRAPRSVPPPSSSPPHDAALPPLPPPPASAADPQPPLPPPPGPRKPRTEPRDLIGALVGGRYKIRTLLGEGGMGTVYDAEHLGLERSVAVKVLNPAQARKRVAVKRFQQEARAAGAIGHPNICEVYDMGLLDDGSPYLVMERLVGNTLADRIKKEGGLPFDDILGVVVQVLAGLTAAHEKGIVHRDIKPENVFLTQRLSSTPVVKLLDFGVSKMMAEFTSPDENLELTRTGMVMGTPYYMAPEQARGERDLDGRVDVYATGVMMYEAITGRRPFLAPNYNALLLAIINTEPPRISELRPDTPAALESIVMKALRKDRNARYRSASHVLRDLKVFLGPNATPDAGKPAHALPPPPTAEERRRAPVLGGKRPKVDAKTRDGVRAPSSPQGFDDLPTEVFRPGASPVPPGAPPPPRWDDETEQLTPRRRR